MYNTESAGSLTEERLASEVGYARYFDVGRQVQWWARESV